MPRSSVGERRRHGGRSARVTARSSPVSLPAHSEGCIFVPFKICTGYGVCTGHVVLRSNSKSILAPSSMWVVAHALGMVVLHLVERIAGIRRGCSEDDWQHATCTDDTVYRPAELTLFLNMQHDPPPPLPKMTRTLFPPHSERSGNAFWPPAFGTFPERPERGPPGDLEARARSRRGTVCTPK